MRSTAIQLLAVTARAGEVVAGTGDSVQPAQ